MERVRLALVAIVAMGCLAGCGRAELEGDWRGGSLLLNEDGSFRVAVATPVGAQLWMRSWRNKRDPGDAPRGDVFTGKWGVVRGGKLFIRPIHLIERDSGRDRVMEKRSRARAVELEYSLEGTVLTLYRGDRPIQKLKKQ